MEPISSAADMASTFSRCAVSGDIICLRVLVKCLAKHLLDAHTKSEAAGEVPKTVDAMELAKLTNRSCFHIKSQSNFACCFFCLNV
jgi:hypothetical protein